MLGPVPSGACGHLDDTIDESSLPIAQLAEYGSANVPTVAVHAAPCNTRSGPPFHVSQTEEEIGPFVHVALTVLFWPRPAPTKHNRSSMHR